MTNSFILFFQTFFLGLNNVEKNSVSGSSQLEQLATLVVEKMEIFLKQEGIKNMIYFKYLTQSFSFVTYSNLFL